jgi:hypothetical protein
MPSGDAFTVFRQEIRRAAQLRVTKDELIGSQTKPSR